MTDNHSHWIELMHAPSQGVTVVQTLSGYEALLSKPSNSSNDSAGEPSLNAMYGQFNLGLHVGDDSVQVHQNRAHLLQSLQHYHPALNSIHWLNQIHGNDIYQVTDKIGTAAIPADAHITRLPNVALAIMTADCVPVMIATEATDDNKLIAAIHAGWQGLSKNIIAKTVQKMVHQFDFAAGDNATAEMQKVTRRWHAWIGASIAQSSYEVDSRVKDVVLSVLNVSEAVANQLFQPNADKVGHYFADLPAIAELQLKACGIHQVHKSGLDSHSDARFYSYRRQTQHQLPATGRMATLIFME
ncbi:peptidoglycan editing factor PgeF [Moraxella osloensis]|nr:peptidoglycan editing factor PgeF [Moraxella osloensis]UAY36985.1 peptidoglycan editing factor PgeF [Moraxella osloensis]